MARGHQAEFLLWVVRAWERRGERRPLVVVSPPAVLEQRPELGERFARQPGVRFDPTPERTYGSTSLHNLVGIHRGAPLAAAAWRHRPERILVMSFEHVIAPLAARLPLPEGARVAALTLRPPGAVPASPPAQALSRRSAARSWAYRAALRHPRVDILLSLDPTALLTLRAGSPQVRVEAVPDPLPPGEATEPSAAVRARYGIDPARRLLVLPGELDPRKGALRLAEAVGHLSPEVARSVAVLFAGKAAASVREPLRALAADPQTPAQVVLADGYLPTEALPSLLAAADLVVLPYVDHVGSSGFQLRAAAAGVPALAPAHGLMALTARAHRLGPTVDTRSAEAIAQAIEGALANPSAAFDAEGARAFAASRTVEAFADALLDPLSRHGQVARALYAG